MGTGTDNGIAVERELPCKLTEQETLARGDSMAECELRIEALKAKRRELNASIAEQVEERAKLAHTIDSGEEARTVLCKWISNYATNQLALIRQDNGAEVEARAMTARDRQDVIDFDHAADGGGGEVVDPDPFGLKPAEVVQVGPERIEVESPPKRKRGAGKSRGGLVVKFASVDDAAVAMTAATATLKRNRTAKATAAPRRITKTNGTGGSAGKGKTRSHHARA